MAKLNLKDEIQIPAGTTVTMNGAILKVVGKSGNLERRISHPMIKVAIADNKLTLSLKNGSKREKMMMKTFKAHIKNMIKGASEKYTYKLKVCSSHFPMTVVKEGKKLTVKNFLGEKIPRHADIMEGVEVEIHGAEIIVIGADKEKTGQTAANIERSTRLTNKDRRKFQDGIYITEKSGVEI